MTVRLVFPKLDFDLISLTLLAIATLAILIDNPEKLFKNTKRLKIGSLEIELKELDKEVEKIEEQTIIEHPKADTLSGTGKTQNNYYQISNDLSTETLRLSIEIEKSLRQIYDGYFHSEEKRPIAVTRLIETLKENKLIDNETYHLLRKFWSLRNKLIHDYSFEMDEKALVSFVDSGIRILNIVKTLRDNLAEGKIPYYGIN